MPPSAEATQNTPLAPSVEKAYYRKCIELKRRLNEVEEANDAYRLRKLRLTRAVLKMRLERAFLLDQLAKRMEFEDEEDEQEQEAREGSSQPHPSSRAKDDPARSSSDMDTTIIRALRLFPTSPPLQRPRCSSQPLPQQFVGFAPDTEANDEQSGADVRYYYDYSFAFRDRDQAPVAEARQHDLAGSLPESYARSQESSPEQVRETVEGRK